MSFKKHDRGQSLHFTGRWWPGVIALTVWCTVCMVNCLQLPAQQPATFREQLQARVRRRRTRDATDEQAA